MTFSDLLRDRKIAPEPSVKEQVPAQLEAARRDLETARKLGPDDEWAYAISYNAMPLAGRALMFSEGYRPRSGEGAHAVVVEFLDARLDKSFKPLITVMDRMRRQRHRVVYTTVGAVSRTQIVEALETAEEFIERIEQLLRPA